ncbi:LemA family protein [Rhodobium gokarnense]|uniref:LemA protein n=1 Tax=Rhodobium gokarnense TaxID=364296 RepID=A0ABT3HD09_9HYPH|nr:LemA family protein [Rhodobium gokarnense]MCW2308260.1 LemA protein [Rhodobium gokarnense]
MITWIILAVVVLAAIYGVVLYNRLVKFRQMVAEGWSGIDVQLKRRANLIPNLMEAVKGYMGHERETLEEVTALRARAEKASEEDADPARRSLIEGALSGALGRLFALAENYPDLKASQNFIDFQDALEAVEEQIQLSRRYYNGAVRNLNVAVESFPSNLVASTFKFEKADYFELEATEDRAVPKVSF